MTARDEAIYRDQRIPPLATTSTQVGFAQVALLRVLNGVPQPDRDRWIKRYKAIQSRIEAAIFMVDAKPKLRYDIDPPDTAHDRVGSAL